MDKNELDLEASNEEQNAELDATMEVDEDELRDKLAEEFGIDVDSDNGSELLEKLVAREKANHERLTGAIKQKIRWREKAKGTSENSKDNPKAKKLNDESAELSRETIRAEVRAELEERDLLNLNLPEEITPEVKALAKVRNISIREASESPYIKFRIEEVKKEKSLLEASTKRSNRGDITRISDLDLTKPLNPDEFKTEDGKFDVEKWDKAKAAKARLASRQQS